MIGGGVVPPTDAEAEEHGARARPTTPASGCARCCAPGTPLAPSPTARHGHDELGDVHLGRQTRDLAAVGELCSLLAQQEHPAVAQHAADVADVVVGGDRATPGAACLGTAMRRTSAAVTRRPGRCPARAITGLGVRRRRTRPVVAGARFVAQERRRTPRTTPTAGTGRRSPPTARRSPRLDAARPDVLEHEVELGDAVTAHLVLRLCIASSDVGPGSENPATPPGRRTLPISATTSATFGTWCSASKQSTRSTLASSRSMCRPSNNENVGSGRTPNTGCSAKRRRPSSSMAADTSMATTRHPICVRKCEVQQLPAPKSSTVISGSGASPPSRRPKHASTSGASRSDEQGLASRAAGVLHGPHELVGAPGEAFHGGRRRELPGIDQLVGTRTGARQRVPPVRRSPAARPARSAGGAW